MSKVAINVSRATHAKVKRFAKERGLDVSEAGDKLINTALGRRAAVAKYTKRRKK